MRARQDAAVVLAVGAGSREDPLDRGYVVAERFDGHWRRGSGRVSGCLAVFFLHGGQRSLDGGELLLGFVECLGVLEGLTDALGCFGLGPLSLVEVFVNVGDQGRNG